MNKFYFLISVTSSKFDYLFLQITWDKLGCSDLFPWSRIIHNHVVITPIGKERFAAGKIRNE